MRILPQQFIDGICSGVVTPVLMCDLTFKSGVTRVWSGVGNLTYGGNTYLGVGTLGSVGTISEGTSVEASGTTVSLSGVDPNLYAESLNDIQLGAPATIYFGILSGGLVYAYTAYAGQMDKPTITTGGDAITISIALENRLVNLQRPSALRYTTEDQHALGYTNDCGFSWAPMLNNIALKVDR